MSAGDGELHSIVGGFRDAADQLDATWDDTRGRLVRERYVAPLRAALGEQLAASASQAESFADAEQLGQLTTDHLGRLDLALRSHAETLARGAAGVEAAADAAQTSLELARRADLACDDALCLLQRAVPCAGKVPLSAEAVSELAWAVTKPVAAEGAKLLVEEAVESIFDVAVPDGAVDQVVESAQIAGVHARGWLTKRGIKD